MSFTSLFRDAPQAQTRNLEIINLEIPGSMGSLSSGRAMRGPVGSSPGMTSQKFRHAIHIL